MGSMVSSDDHELEFYECLHSYHKILSKIARYSKINSQFKQSISVLSEVKYVGTVASFGGPTEVA